MARGGGSFDPSWRKVEVKILFNVAGDVRPVWGTPSCDLPLRAGGGGLHQDAGSPLPGQVHSTYHIECIAAAAEALGALPFTPLNAEAAVEARVWVGNAFIGNAPMKPELQ